MYLFNSHQNVKALESGTNSSTLSISVCLTSVNSCTFN